MLFLLLSANAGAQRPPIRAYTMEDGLASDVVRRLVRDPNGFLWLCTTNGLSRFDGERFTTYTPETGLPHASINDLLVTGRGRYLIATNGAGVVAFDVSSPLSATDASSRHRTSEPRPDAWRFRAYRVGTQAATNRVNLFKQDRRGRIWVGTDGGLFVLERWREPFRFVRVPLLGATPDSSVQVWAFAEDREGSLWIGTGGGLTRRLPDGRLVHYEWSTSRGRALGLAYARNGILWVGHDGGLTAIVPEPASSLEIGSGASLTRTLLNEDPMDASTALPETPGHARSWTGGVDGIPAPVTALTSSDDGHLWLAGPDRLVEFDGRRFRSFEVMVGSRSPTPLLEDADGHIWIGTSGEGALRFARSGFLTFTQAEGASGAFVGTFQTRDRQICAFTANGVVSCYDGERFALVGSPSSWKNGWLVGARTVLEDRKNQWWMTTSRGLHRFRPGARLVDLPRVQPLRTYTSRDGVPSDDLASLYEDSRGDIWVGTFEPNRRVVARWERATDRLVTYDDAPGLPAFTRPSSFAEDRSGALWIGLAEGGLVRHRNGRFELFTEDDGVPPGDWTSVRVDRAGRLWVATSSGGVLRVDKPDVRPLEGKRYTTVQGLATDDVFSVTEDTQGRIYLGTSRGLDRLDPDTDRIKHYTRSDGLVSNIVIGTRPDLDGALWFRSGGGLSRFVPAAARPVRSPHVAIDGAFVGENLVPLRALGETAVALGVVPGAGPVQISVVGSSFGTAGRLRFQYQLEGSDETWSAPTVERNVRFARLAAGRYRLLVRAVDSDGAVSPRPASVTFRVLPAIWLRWWFLTLAAASAVLLAYMAHRYRVRQLFALERIRSRIATDLHDEVGANLSQIAVLSEVARRRFSEGDDRVVEPLSRIADVSRESVDAMSDIVWAVDPERDDLIELEHRIRRFANDVLAGRDIVVRFPTSVTAEGVSADADIRRDVFLIFKEAVNNVVRHAEATAVQVDLRVRRHTLDLTVADNGTGLASADPSRGLGLRSMRERAKRLRGHIDITSPDGAGTRVSLTVPLTRRH